MRNVRVIYKLPKSERLRLRMKTNDKVCDGSFERYVRSTYNIIMSLRAMSELLSKRFAVL